MIKRYSPAQVLYVLRRYKWLILWCLIVFSAAGAGYASRIADTYQAEAIIAVVPQRVPQNYVRSVDPSSSRDRVESIGREILSRGGLERTIAALELFPPETTLTEELLDAVRNRIDVNAISDDAFSVSFSGGTPEIAKRGVDFLTTLYIEQNQSVREGFTEGTRTFLSAELNNARKLLVAQEQRLQNYRLKYADELPMQQNANIQRLAIAEQRAHTIRESIDQARARQAGLEATPTVTASDPAPPAPQGSAGYELEQARTQRKEMLENLTPQHPDVIALERRIRALETQARAEDTAVPRQTVQSEKATTARQQALAAIADQIATYQAELDLLNAEIAEYQRRISAVPQHEAGLAELSRDHQTTQGLYEKLLGQLQESQLAASLEQRQVAERFRLLDPARLPDEPIGPDRGRLILLGVMLGLAVAGGIVFVLDQSDTTLRDQSELHAALQLPVIATVPILWSRGERWRRRAVTAALSLATLAGAAASSVIVALTLGIITRADVQRILWF